eukprot:TRINITY_DN341_c9_g1_i1.p1 TRINITY_DN341_c9_g1~~TRINITY_DN341_c9_g1_i1.p1  ORF type:complete len:663 (+),score=112.95 TRINITY_DN341_c9_g1_i1:65-1990(+)
MRISRLAALLATVAASNASSNWIGRYHHKNCSETMKEICSSSEYCGGKASLNCSVPDTCSECGLTFYASVGYTCSYDQLQSVCKVPPTANTTVKASLKGLGDIEGYIPAGSKHKYFRGIPYAAPPVGKLRFHSPQEVSPWNGTLITKDFKAPCAQLGPAWNSLQDIRESTEDCLFLNVYSPTTLKPGKPAPIMMYVPAGQYMWGASDDVENLQAPLGNSSSDVIYVTLGYRVGPFGFLALPEIKEWGEGGSMGNFAMQDQRMALKFLKTHAASFGGDPNNIVLWGESAGATSVSTQLVLKKSMPYFNKAIIESGAFNKWTYKTLDTAITNSRKVMSNLYHLVNDSSICPGSSTKDDIITCLTNCNTTIILESADDVFGKAQLPPYTIPYGDTMDKCAWAPVVDGVELEEDPITLLGKGEVAKIPIILGTNRDEGSTFTSSQTGHGDNTTTEVGFYHRYITSSSMTNESQFLNWSAAIWGSTAADQFAQIYQPDGYKIPTWWWAMSHVVGDFVLSCPARHAARMLHEAGAIPFVYYFNRTPEISVNNRNTTEIGAFHGSEVPFVFFDQFELKGSEVELSRNMVEAWATFAKTGNPNFDSLPVTWKPYTYEEDEMIVLGGSPVNITTIVGLKQQVCNFWRPYL